LEKRLPVTLGKGPDAECQAFWQLYWTMLQEVIAPWPAALALAKQRVAANLVVWKSQAPPETKLWLLAQTFWVALQKYPEAEKAANQALHEIECASTGQEHSPHLPELADASSLQPVQEGSLEGLDLDVKPLFLAEENA
jgi:hypothetical protein